MEILKSKTIKNRSSLVNYVIALQPILCHKQKPCAKVNNSIAKFKQNPFSSLTLLSNKHPSIETSKLCFRPWDETYRGQAGWDAGGRGYYFASGRPDSTWGQREYSRPSSSGWQNVGYSNGVNGYRDQVYRGSTGYGSASAGYGSGSAGYGSGSAGYGSGSAGYESGLGYRSGLGYSSGSGYGSGSVYAPGLGYSSGSGYGPGYADGYQDVGYGQSSGWRNVGERRPYRDQSGVATTITRVVQENPYGQNRQPGPSQPTHKPATYSQSTTLATSYLHQRDDKHVTKTDTTVAPF